ncbi:Flp family type IVb pilin [Streptomyces sp. NPDC053560]|uniref:Flp family type IVb pilin n=1 Tax=Streptomyces sp. NPDC053560 TaxID=3365711 RepID=UPI0037D3BE00
MNQRMLKATTATQVRIGSWRDACIERMYGRERSKGQTAVEYIGMIVVVVAIMAAIAGFTDIGTTIKTKIKEAISSVKTGG